MVDLDLKDFGRGNDSKELFLEKALKKTLHKINSRCFMDRLSHLSAYRRFYFRRIRNIL
jgi:hypothetical protein